MVIYRVGGEKGKRRVEEDGREGRIGKSKIEYNQRDVCLRPGGWNLIKVFYLREVR